jgi:pyruvate carboxylase
MLRGDLGQPAGGWPNALQAKVLKGEKPIIVRPGSLLAPADLDAERAAAEKACGRQISDDELASYLMYPKVFTEYAATVRRYGPVSVLPTPIFFYGMQPGREISVEIESGKSLVIVLMTIGETDEEGHVKVFFELNGQPRIIWVRNLSAAAKTAPRRKAEDGNPSHIAAPMPGSVATIAVRPGQEVAAGDVIATLEAMKMETVLHAPRDGKIAEILVMPGQHIDTKDLLMRIETHVAA